MIFYLLCDQKVGDQYEIIVASLYIYYLLYLFRDENLFYGMMMLDIVLLYSKNPLKPLAIRYSKKVDQKLTEEKVKKQARKVKHRRYRGGKRSRKVQFQDQNMQMMYNISDPPRYVQNYSYNAVPIEQRYEQLATQYEQPTYVKDRMEFQANNFAIDTRNQMNAIAEVDDGNFLLQNTQNEYNNDTISEMSVDNDIIWKIDMFQLIWSNMSNFYDLVTSTRGDESPFQRLVDENNEMMYEMEPTEREIADRINFIRYNNYKCIIVSNLNMCTNQRPNNVDYALSNFNGRFLYEEWVQVCF